jgi:hypothetical protein
MGDDYDVDNVIAFGFDWSRPAKLPDCRQAFPYRDYGRFVRDPALRTGCERRGYDRLALARRLP